MTGQATAARKGKRARWRMFLTRMLPLAVLGLGLAEAMIKLVTTILKLIAR
jgi:hypothetical protein